MSQSIPIETLSKLQQDKFRWYLSTPKIGDLAPRIGEAFFPEWDVKYNFSDLNHWEDHWMNVTPTESWHNQNPQSDLEFIDGETILYSKGGRRVYTWGGDGSGPGVELIGGSREALIIRLEIFDPMESVDGLLAGNEYAEFGSGNSLLAIGLHDNVDIGSYSSSKYQFRIGEGGWIQLDSRRKEGRRVFDIVINSGRIYLYVDGVLDSQVEGIPTTINLIDTMYLGSLLETKVGLYYQRVFLGKLIPKELTFLDESNNQDENKSFETFIEMDVKTTIGDYDADPSKGKFWFRMNSGFKTEFVVQFPSGDITVIAVEP